MKVRVKIIGVSESPAGFEGQKEMAMDCPGNSVGDLLAHLVSGTDTETRGSFLNGQGGILTDLATIVNGIMISDSNRANFRLKEGDLVELVSSPG
jgi:sulfur carrier protein ThiS